MSAICGSTEKVARQLSHEMIQVSPDLDKIQSLFSEHATFRFADISFDLSEFINKMQTGHLGNVRKIIFWFQAWKTPDPLTGDVVWTSAGEQKRLGLGTGEDGMGIYRIFSKIVLSFQEENGQLKITNFHAEKYVKIKAPESHNDLPQLVFFRRR